MLSSYIRTPASPKSFPSVGASQVPQRVAGLAGTAGRVEPLRLPPAQLGKTTPRECESAGLRRRLGSSSPSAVLLAPSEAWPLPVTRRDAVTAATTPLPQTLIQTRLRACAPSAAEPGLLALCAQQIVATNVPPEDQDGSGDDSDNFSGSGAGALPDITLSRQTSSTWKDVWLLTATPTAPEPTSRDAETAFTSTLPAEEKQEEGEAVLLAEVETGLTGRDKEKEVTPGPRETTQLPSTQQASTTRATTAQAPVSSHPHRDVQPGLHETLAPTSPGQPDHHPPNVKDGGASTIEEAAEDGAANQLPTGEGSGEQDFTFETSGENTAVAVAEPDQRNQPPVDEGATGASQGLLDRKEVLGGVIAGGLVGLIFAVCLVGFMLYRMKKKDEGSYSLEEPKQANGGAYQKPTKQEEFYA